MNHEADAPIKNIPGAPVITLSDDGYVRLTFETFRSTPLVHMLSALDEDDPAPSREGATLAVIAGYTEWFSTTTPAITIGWDWRLTASQGQPCCIRMGEPRSNVMFLDAQQRDLGPANTARLLEAAIDALCWQDEIVNAITTQYA